MIDIVVALMLVGGLVLWVVLELFAPDHVGR